jgi:hypothetical protein
MQFAAAMLAPAVAWRSGSLQFAWLYWRHSLTALPAPRKLPSPRQPRVTPFVHWARVAAHAAWACAAIAGLRPDGIPATHEFAASVHWVVPCVVQTLVTFELLAPEHGLKLTHRARAAAAPLATEW